MPESLHAVGSGNANECGKSTGLEGGESAEGEVAGANVNVELVPAAPTLLEGSEQSAMGFGEGRGLQVAGHNRGVDVTVVGRIADGDGQVAGVEFDVLVARHSLDGEISSRHAHEKDGVVGNFDGDFKIILGASKDADVRIIAGPPEANRKVASVVGITPIELDCEPITFAADDPEFAGAEVQAQMASGREIDGEGVILKVFSREIGVR